MLMQLGEVTFEVAPFNADSVNRETGYDFASKDVMGRRRPREAMGEADEYVDISGTLFPEKFGGLSTMDTLHKMRQGGTPQILVRGDGLKMGWFLIEKIREKSTYLDAQGVGKKIDFDIQLTLADKPSAGDYLRTLLRLFI